MGSASTFTTSTRRVPSGHCPITCTAVASTSSPTSRRCVEAKRRGYPVKLGLEVDYLPDRAEQLDEILAPYPWDYLIGSIHFIDGLGIDQEPSLVGAVGVEQAWARYYESLDDAARWVDILGHPDLIKFIGPEIEWDWVELATHLEDVCLEVSSAGLHKPHGKIYPNALLLSAAREQGLPITLASDAHVPQHVGRDLDRASSMPVRRDTRQSRSSTGANLVRSRSDERPARRARR